MGRKMVRSLSSALLLAAVACSFDPSGSGPGDDDQPAAPDARLDGGATAPDGGPTDDHDAAPMCVDRDGDGYPWPNTPGASCGPDLDCDDDDEDAFPGQPNGFTEPTAAGSYDYDCDGAETPLAEQTLGGDCALDWFDCIGTGWMDTVPRCGELGVWHECSGDIFSCGEREQVAAKMPCK